MTKSVGVHEAKTHLSRLIEDVAAGDEIVIRAAGKAVASLGPPPSQAPQQFGSTAGVSSCPRTSTHRFPDELLAEFER